MEKLLSICPKLNAFNKVFIARHGAGLIQNIELLGSSEDIEAFIADEILLLSKNGAIINEKVVTDIKDTNSPQAYLLKSDQGLTRIHGNLYFFSEHCSDSNKNVFDITGYKEDPLQKILNAIALSGLTLEILSDAKSKVPNVSDEKFINDTILQHYEHFDDDIFHEEDFSWISKTDTVVEEKANDMALKEDTEKVTTSDKVSKEDTEKVTHKTGSPMEALKEKLDKVMSEANKSKEEPSVSESPVPENTANEGQKEKPPVPVIKEKESTKKYSFDKVKEQLTPEEEAQNEELVQDLVQKYKDVSNFIEKMHASQWLSICRKIENAAKTRTFNTQWAPLYLEVSDNVSTELYAKLYQLDLDTVEFHKNITHQIIELGCFACGQNWTEDITFLQKGAHFIECPHCYAERGFEKL